MLFSFVSINVLYLNISNVLLKQKRVCLLRRIIALILTFSLAVNFLPKSMQWNRNYQLRSVVADGGFLIEIGKSKSVAKESTRLQATLFRLE